MYAPGDGHRPRPNASGDLGDTTRLVKYEVFAVRYGKMFRDAPKGTWREAGSQLTRGFAIAANRAFSFFANNRRA